MELGRFLAGLHPSLVHFPIVLILLGVTCDLLFAFRRDERLAWAGSWLTLLGTAAALVAFVTGILAETFAARAGIPQEPIEYHERYATIVTWLFIALASVRLFMGTNPRSKAIGWYVAFAVLGGGLLVLTAHRGGEIVYQYGANVAGAQPLHGPSDEDLATIAQHQEQSSLAYSNQMHHIFGWLVLALAVAVFCERLKLRKFENLRWLMPAVFVGGGVYLFLFSDWDSWPISDLRPITDAEVLLHKILSIVMVGVGVAALFRRGRRSGNDSSNAGKRWAWQNKLIAVMALAGGGALFTHIHTNAPYTANAIGVYLHHTVMGIFALATAAAVLLEEVRTRSRFVPLFLPTLLLAQALLLLKYNEDMPWFLGYHEIVATPPSGGVLAQAPGGRAELVFGNDSGVLDVYFWQPKDAAPLAVAADTLSGAIDTPSRRTVVELAAVEAHHFRAHADWLRRVPLFTLHLDVPRENNGRPWTAVFDPWVTAPILPPLVGAEQVYGCPMCADVLSSKPADCPMCGMELEDVPRERMLRKPSFTHDERFEMELRTQPETPRAGEPCELVFTMRDTVEDSIIRDFRVVHEKLLHLLIVSKDLSWFDHVHPELQSDGSFTLRQTFPFGGEFRLFADVTPSDARMQAFRLPLRVEGEPRPSVPLSENTRLTRAFDGHMVSLRVTPKPPRAKDHAQLTFTITKDGKAVDDLGMFLGALGHCVIIHEDTETFVHTHATQLTAVAPPPGGPDVTFHAHLPRTGRYKVWGQFEHGGEIITADFVFRAEWGLFETIKAWLQGY